MGGSNFEVSFESEHYWTGMLGKGFKGGAKVDEDTVGTHPSVSICNADGTPAFWYLEGDDVLYAY